MVLPIGTVVRLDNQSDIKFMIVGYFPQNDKGEQRDYTAIRYPMGVYDSRMYFFFNSTDIKEILYRGYEDNEFAAMQAVIDKSSLKMADKMSG